VLVARGGIRRWTPTGAVVLLVTVIVATSSCSSSRGSPRGQESTTRTVVVQEATAFVEHMASAARERSYTATYQVGDDPQSTVEVVRQPERAVIWLRGTKLGSSESPIGSQAEPISLHLTQGRNTLVACGTEAGSPRCYDFAPLFDAALEDKEPFYESALFGTKAYEEMAGEIRRPEAAGTVYSLSRRSSPVGELRCIAFAESIAALAQGETEGFCANVDGVRATSVDASEEFASNLVAYEDAVDTDAFRLPSPAQPLRNAISE